jgi:TatD DNase family protein
MNLPKSGDYIDIHSHGSFRSGNGIFVIENLMVHEGKSPGDIPEQACSYGIHPWFLNKNNHEEQIRSFKENAGYPNLIAIGEAGFDRLRGPESELQHEVFEEQVKIADINLKPVIIHCVKGWEELLLAHKKLKPKRPWLIHGFRGNEYLAAQLISKGMYISFWFDFVIRPESAPLLKSIPLHRIFLETDGAEIDIREIYKKVSGDLDLSVEELKAKIVSNYFNLFSSPITKKVL